MREDQVLSGFSHPSSQISMEQNFDLLEYYLGTEVMRNRINNRYLSCQLLVQYHQRVLKIHPSKPVNSMQSKSILDIQRSLSSDNSWA